MDTLKYCVTKGKRKKKLMKNAKDLDTHAGQQGIKNLVVPTFLSSFIIRR